MNKWGVTALVVGPVLAIGIALFVILKPPAAVVAEANPPVNREPAKSTTRHQPSLPPAPSSPNVPSLVVPATPVPAPRPPVSESPPAPRRSQSPSPDETRKKEFLRKISETIESLEQIEADSEVHVESALFKSHLADSKLKSNRLRAWCNDSEKNSKMFSLVEKILTEFANGESEREWQKSCMDDAEKYRAKGEYELSSLCSKQAMESMDRGKKSREECQRLFAELRTEYAQASNDANF